MQETTAREGVGKSSVAKFIQTLMSEDTSFMCHKDSEIHFMPYTRILDKGELEKRIIMGTYFTLADAFIIMAVHTMGYAVMPQIRDWLTLYKKQNPQKAVPTYTHVGGEGELFSRLKHLCVNGLLAGQVFVAAARPVEIYTCTNYGHIYFRNQLEVYSVYDQSLLVRSLYEISKRLAANSVLLAFAKNKACLEFGVNEHVKSESGEDIGFVYGHAVLQGKEEKHRYIIEPIYFVFDEKRVTQEECMGKLEKRLEKLKEMVEKSTLDMPTDLVLVMENMSGLKKFEQMIRPIGPGIFTEALYTSENVVRGAKGMLNSVFLKLSYKGDQARISHFKDAIFG